jgi:hypothetical protein
MNTLHLIIAIIFAIVLLSVWMAIPSPSIRWREIRGRKWKFTWKLRTPMSGGFRRNFYGWSIGTRFGGAMFTRMAMCFLAITALSLSGCLSPTQLSTAQSAISRVSTESTTLSGDITKAQQAVAAVTGTNSTQAENAFGFAEMLASNAPTLAPLLSDVLTMFSTSANGHRYWNARGLAMLHRHGISPRDPRAVAKLETILSGRLKLEAACLLHAGCQAADYKAPSNGVITVRSRYTIGQVGCKSRPAQTPSLALAGL